MDAFLQFYMDLYTARAHYTTEGLQGYLHIIILPSQDKKYLDSPIILDELDQT